MHVSFFITICSLFISSIYLLEVLHINMKIRASTLTVNKLLLVMRQNASKMTTQNTTFMLCYIPWAPVREIPVAMALKLMPTIAACFCVCKEKYINYSVNYLCKELNAIYFCTVKSSKCIDLSWYYKSDYVRWTSWPLLHFLRACDFYLSFILVVYYTPLH